MVYFITMQEMPHAPKSDIPNVLFFPEDGMLHFAVEYALFPSSSKRLQYKIFFIHVDKNGNAHSNTPLYGLNAFDLTIFNNDTVKKVASSIQMVIAITCKQWYKYYEHSPAGIEYADVVRLGRLFENYLRFVPINAQSLEHIFFDKFGSFPSDFELKTGSIFPNRTTAARPEIYAEARVNLYSEILSSPSNVHESPFFVPPPPIPSDQLVQPLFESESTGSTQVTESVVKPQRVLHSTPTTTLYPRWDPSDLCAAQLQVTQPVSGCDHYDFDEASLQGVFDDI